MKSKIVFLDVDGVLNWHDTWLGVNEDGAATLDPQCCDELARIIKTTDATVVLSSTWRLGFPDSESCVKLVDWLEARGISIHSITPDLWDEYGSIMCRGHEIQKWLDTKASEFPNPRFVILDDDNDMNADQQQFFVQTDFMNGGLTSELADKAIQILSEK